MWARSLIVIAVLAGPAAAEFDASPPRDLEPTVRTPRIRIGHPGDTLTIDKMAVTIRQDELGTSAHITLLVTTTDKAAREAAMALEIPRGARVSGVALTLGKTERMVAVAMGPERARTDYQTILNRGKDPILVEWNGEAPGVDVLDIKAFPLTKTDPGRIELTIELPQLPSLTIDASARTIEIVNGARSVTHRKTMRPITIELPQQREIAAVSRTAPRPYVNATTSFYVGMPLSMEVPTITFGGRPPRRQGPFSSVDKQEIRKEIKRHIVRLGRCYEQVVEYKGGIEGEAVLHFQIDGDGKVASTTIDGTIEDETIISCLEGVVAQFEFRPGDGNVIVNYPLRFQLAL